MSNPLQFWDSFSQIGARRAKDPVAAKILRFTNRLAVISSAITVLQAITFFRLGLIYPAVISIAAGVSYCGCLVLTYFGRKTLARVVYLSIAVAAIMHHHLYFGFASGFWLLLLPLAQAGFVLFPELRMRIHLLIGALSCAGIIAVLLASENLQPFFVAMTDDFVKSFLRGNLIRSPLLFMVIAFYLVYENRQTERELDFTAKKANDAATAKAFFLSNISHELRTPMNAIKGFADILFENSSILEEKYRHEFKKQLGQIRISAANLTSIIDDLLDFTRVDAGRISFNRKDFELHEIARNVMQTAEFYNHHGKKIETRLVLADDLPKLLKGDPVRLSQVLLNLIGNAVKFTHHGFVELRINNTGESGNGYNLRFEVEDTGIGIPAEKLPYLFDSLSPVSRETAVRYGGTGLGLAISKHLVEMQNGTITVMSSPGKGSIFSINLWFEKGESAEAADAGAARDLNRAKILIAEDNEVNQMLVQTLLEKWNADIHLVENGLNALGELQKNKYDLILMDLQMPFMDGFEATENIRQLENQEKASVPIIALTADVLSETRKKVFAVGMNDIVTKPINQADLYAALRKGLNRVSSSAV